MSARSKESTGNWLPQESSIKIGKTATSTAGLEPRTKLRCAVTPGGENSRCPGV